MSFQRLVLGLLVASVVGCGSSEELRPAEEAAIRRMLESDAAARARMTEAGAAEIECHYTEGAIVSAYVDLYAALRGQTRIDC